MTDLLRVPTSEEHATPQPVTPANGGGNPSDEAPSPHAGHFRAAVAMLAGVAIGAIVIALVLLAGGRSGGSGGKWSDWSPQSDGTQGAREIADHLAPLYRIDGTTQLDIITLANVANASATVSSSGAASGSGASNASSSLQVAVRANPSTGAVSLLGGHTIAYDLCGIGTSNCSIGTGAPSANRLLLLRRQALELALYTFKYISGAQYVVAILPPGHTQPVGTLTPKPPGAHAASATKPVNVALLFQHDELKPFLDQPITNTLPEQIPPMLGQLPLWKQTSEAELVSYITGHGLFSEHLTTAQDGSSLILLDPLPPQ